MSTFWRDRRVLLTGHTGFKGAWLSLWLQRLGASVAGYALPPPTDPSIFDAARVATGMASEEGDVRDPAALAAAVARHRPEVVFHLAAQALVRASYEEPAETYATNVLGTVHLLEAVRRTPGVRAVVVVTSDKCYENREWVWGYREGEPLGGRDPYSSSKACAELVAASWRSSFFPLDRHGQHGVAVATVRAGNVIGGGDWARDRLVPDVVRALAAGEAALIRNPSAVRPWQHVLEPLAGYLELARRLVEDGPGFADAWNFGPRLDDARPVSHLADRLCALWGGGRWVRGEGEQPHEAHLLHLDSSRATRLLGWRPRLDLERSLAWTVEWYRAHAAGERMRELCERQLAAYEELSRREGER